MDQIKTTPIELITQRLRLIPLEIELFRLMWDNMPEVENRLGLNHADVQLPPEIEEEMNISFYRMLALAEQDPKNFPWYTHWLMITRDGHQIIGSTYFAGPPDKQGRVYTGYWIDSWHQNQGYMSETLLAIAAWVFTHPAANTIYAETPQDNPASQRVLEKNGFRKVKTLEKTILWEAQRDKVPLHDDTRKQTL